MPQVDRASSPTNGTGEPTLARRLGPFDATMIVMGGIIGGGIFVNPSEVARRVHTPGLSLTAWAIGGAIALVGAFVYAELAALRPRVGGQYAYLRDAYHPIVAFLYGWTLLLVVQTGGMAAAAIIFGRYFQELTGLGISTQVVAASTLAILAVVNCLGVRAGSNVQSALMLTKLAAIAMLIVVGLTSSNVPSPDKLVSTEASGGFSGLATAMVPVLFAYGGWQTASFVSGEMRDPRRDLPRGMLIGVMGVVVLYLLVSFVCLRVLGIGGLEQTHTPASDVMRRALGETGARLIALGIAISTVGFLSQSVLTAPRVYYAMARDGVFFSAVGKLHPTSRVPVVAILLQGAWAAVIAMTGRYDQILNYVEAIDVLFFGLTGASLLIFRARERREGPVGDRIRVPGHPTTTMVFVAACWAVSLTTVIHRPQSAGVGVGILLIGVLVFQFWKPRPLPSESS
jgi:basic amino acid/polyamine antiporter, APA family